MFVKQVISVEQHDNVASRLVERAVARCSLPAVVFHLQEAEALVSLYAGACNSEPVVGGAIVYDNRFEIAMRLHGERSQTFLDIRFAVVQCNDNAERGAH